MFLANSSEISDAPSEISDVPSGTSSSSGDDLLCNPPYTMVSTTRATLVSRLSRLMAVLNWWPGLLDWNMEQVGEVTE